VKFAGVHNPSAVLTEEQVLQIRAWWAEGLGVAAITRRIKVVGENAVSHVVHNRTWTHLLPKDGA
jgi:hypothetical protein